MKYESINYFRDNRDNYTFKLNDLYRAVEISKQAVYKYNKIFFDVEDKLDFLFFKADELREEHPGCGVESMYYSLQPDFIGRDKFIEIFMDSGYRLKKKKNFRRTTYSTSKYFDNLIEGMVVTRPNQVWQTDITYIYVKDRFYYAVFIIDIYTKKIVGYNVSDNMRATSNIKALKMAIKAHGVPEIHHSDRGSQYIFKDYVKILDDLGVNKSMSKYAFENAFAERINRTIKEEYLEYWKPETFNQLKKDLKRAVKNYNEVRKHQNLNRMTPVEFEEKYVNLLEIERPVFDIFTNGQNRTDTSKLMASVLGQRNEFSFCPINRNKNE